MNLKNFEPLSGKILRPLNSMIAGLVCKCMCVYFAGQCAKCMHFYRLAYMNSKAKICFWYRASTARMIFRMLQAQLILKCKSWCIMHAGANYASRIDAKKRLLTCLQKYMHFIYILVLHSMECPLGQSGLNHWGENTLLEAIKITLMRQNIYVTKFPAGRLNVDGEKWIWVNECSNTYRFTN